MTEITIQPPLDIVAAQQVGREIDELLGQISGHELRLASSYARLGSKLREVKVNMYWGALGFDRFSSFLEDVRLKIDRRRSQVYAILSVAECLLPYLSESKLEEIGITRAHELRRLVNQGGNVLSEILDPDNQTEDGVGTVQLMDYACRPNVTALKLRATVNNILHIHEGPVGNWLDLGGFYAIPDEKKEIEQFWETGRQVLQIGPEESEHETKKQIMLAAARSCTAEWTAELMNAE